MSDTDRELFNCRKVDGVPLRRLGVLSNLPATCAKVEVNDEVRSVIDMEILRAKGMKTKDAEQAIKGVGSLKLAVKRIDLQQKHNWSNNVKPLRKSHQRRA